MLLRDSSKGENEENEGKNKKKSILWGRKGKELRKERGKQTENESEGE